MSIAFGVYTSPDIVGTGNIVKRPRPFGTNISAFGMLSRHPVPLAAMALGPVSLPGRRPIVFGTNLANIGLVTSAKPSPFATAAPPPAVNVAFIQQPLPQVSGIVESIGIYGAPNVVGRRPCPLGTNLPAYGSVRRRPAPKASNVGPATYDMFYILQSPGYVSMLAGDPMLWITETVALTSATSGSAVSVLADAINFNSATAATLHGSNAVVETINAEDLVNFIWNNLVAEGFVLHSATTPSAIAVQNTLETLVLLSGYSSGLVAANAIATTIALQSVAQVLRPGNVAETMNFTAAYNNALTAAQALVSQLIVEDTAAPTATAIFVVQEHVNIANAYASIMTALTSVTENIQLALTITLNGDVFTAWVMNAENTAVSTYTNFPFNSMAPLNGVWYGCTDNGIYSLNGETDAGTNITSRVKTGLMDFDTGLFKRVPEMYIGYTSNGTLALKVVTTDTGVKVENWYAMVLRPATSPRSNRIKIGRGLKSVYYSFELTNISGADFSIDNIALQPLVLERRV